MAKQYGVLKRTNSFLCLSVVVLTAPYWPQANMLTSDWPLTGPWLALTAPKILWDDIGYPNWINTFQFMFIFIIFQNSWEMKIRKIWVYYNRLCQKLNFVSWLSQPHKFAQEGFCIQNLRMYLSFRETKTIWKSDTWLDMKQKNSLIFLGHPV